MTDRDWLGRIAPSPNTLWRGWWDPGTIEPRRRLYDHELVLFTAGACTLRLDGRELACPAGTFAIIPPDTDHVTIAGSARVRRVCVHFDWIWQSGQGLPICAFHPARPRSEWLRPAPAWVPARFFHGRVARERTVEDLLAAAFQRWEAGGADALRARAPLLDALLILLGDAGGGDPAPAQDLAPRIKAALDAVVDEVHDGKAAGEPSLRRLLGGFGVSAEHAGRSFTRAFGVPPLRYLNAVRLERAAALLRRPGARVAAVAHACGFADPRYFARCFRAHTGVRPGQWRNQA